MLALIKVHCSVDLTVLAGETDNPFSSPLLPSPVLLSFPYRRPHALLSSLPLCSFPFSSPHSPFLSFLTFSCLPPLCPSSPPFITSSLFLCPLLYHHCGNHFYVFYHYCGDFVPPRCGIVLGSLHFLWVSCFRGGPFQEPVRSFRFFKSWTPLSYRMTSTTFCC